MKLRSLFSKLCLLNFLLLFKITPILAEPGTFALKPSMQLYISASAQRLSESKLNPENTVFKLEDRQASLDVRPSLKLDDGQFQLIARPQLKSALSSSTIDKKRQTEHSKSTAKWLEAYGNWNASDKVLVSYGVQNYQWGAAETINPSNRIMHETVDAKGILQASQGKNIMRLNVTWLKNLTSVFLAETEPVKDAAVFQAEEVFESKSLMKHEVSWNSGADYIGLVYGAGEVSHPWAGEYFNLSLFEGLTLYTDVSHQKGSKAWYPVEQDQTAIPNAKSVNLIQSKLDDSKVYTFGVGGFRYSFEGGSDFRLEYVFNNAGWNKEETELGLKSIDSSRPLQLSNLKVNATRWMKPGLEYRGQKYGLVSMRLPDFTNIKDLTWYVRYMRSMQDKSDTGYSSIEYSFGDSSTLFATVLASRGEEDAELKSLIASNATIGIRQDF